MRIYLDIETIGTTDPVVIAEIAAGIKHPGNMSKPETIAKWEAEDKPALVAEAVSKTSFDGALGRVICVCVAADEGKVTAIIGEESDVLTDLHKWIGMLPVGPLSAVGHNVAWDVRFLWQRYVVNSIRPPHAIVKACRAKPWDIEDTMLLWNPERDRRISLDRLCKALRVPSSKGDLDGAKVWDYYRAGKIAEIADYCRADVEAMRACHLRMLA